MLIFVVHHCQRYLELKENRYRLIYRNRGKFDSEMKGKKSHIFSFKGITFTIQLNVLNFLLSKVKWMIFCQWDCKILHVMQQIFFFFTNFKWLRLFKWNKCTCMGKMHFHILFFRFIRVDLAGPLWYVIYAKKLKDIK